MQEKKRILIVSANPSDTMPLRVNNELREIGEGLQKAKSREDFEIKPCISARIEDLHSTMLEFKPHILHFCGHGTKEKGIAFESGDINNSSSYVDGTKFAKFLGGFNKHLECVVLNACYSEEQAKKISEQVFYTIGMKDEIEDKNAIKFAISFYLSVFAKWNYEDAFTHTLDFMNLKYTTESSLIPIMFKNGVMIENTIKNQYREKEVCYLEKLIKVCKNSLDKIQSNIYSLEGKVFEKELEEDTGANRIDLRLGYLPYDESGEESEQEDDICKCIKSINKKVVLLGEPGCGKSVSLLKLTIEFAERALTDENELIPILVPLGSFKEEILLLDYAKKQMALDTKYAEELFSTSRCLFLFDALNELASKKRDSVVTHIKKLNRFIVSCRLLDYKKDFSQETDVARIEILPLDLEKIKSAIEHLKPSGASEDFWKAIGGSDFLITFWLNLKKEEHDETFWKSPTLIKTSDLDTFKEESNTCDYEAWIKMHERGLLPLCRNPMLLRMVYDLYKRSGTKLPENRGKLFERFVMECLDSEIKKIKYQNEKPQNKLDELKESTLEFLTCLANSIITNKQGTGIAYSEGKTILEEYFSENEIIEIEKFSRDTNILIVDDNEYRFLHQLHQEYFASRSLNVAFSNGTPACDFFYKEAWWEPCGWEESAVILAGILTDNELSAFLLWLSESQPKLVIRCIENAGISGLSVKTIDSTLKKNLQDMWVERLSSDEESVKSRIYLAQSIEKIGDPRKGVGLVNEGGDIPSIEWIYDDKIALFISKYPVTVKQFSAFFDAVDGYKSQVDLGKSLDIQDWKRLKYLPELSNAPIINISWFDAIAFCIWLSNKSGEKIRLPNEEEWIKFIANNKSVRSIITEKDLEEMDDAKKIVSVGLGNNQIENSKIVDVGLVWEWCNDIFGDKVSPLRLTDTTSLPTRILKGGSWRYSDVYKSVDYRFRTYAAHTSIDIGFRLVKE